MADCPECGHSLGTQEAAVRATLGAAPPGSGVTGHEAQKQMLLGLAAAVDANPESGSLWREFRIAEATFRQNGAGEHDEFEQLVAALATDSD